MSSSSSSSLLDKYWLEFTSNYQLDSDLSTKWLNNIKSNYESRTNYINLQYLNIKLGHYEDAKAQLRAPFTILLALIFQSYFYENKSCSTIAEKNISSFAEFTKEIGLDSQDPNLVSTVTNLIQQQSTGAVGDDDDDDDDDGNENKNNEGGGKEPSLSTYKDSDKYYFMDINFCHLASDWAEYCANSAQTRSEYSSMNDVSYMKLRKKVLQNFLLIPYIFATKLFRDKYEEKARENIQHEINDVLKE